MSRNNKFNVMTIICAAVLVIAVVLGVKGVVGSMGFSYENAGKYTAGDAEIEGTVNNLDIDWTSGKINIAYHGKNTVLVSETANKKISADRQLRWWLDGDTLRIRYQKSGIFVSFWPENLEKELTVTLPEGTVLTDTCIDATSGTLNIPSLETAKLQLEVTSGEIMAAAIAENVSVKATSGDIGLKLAGETKDASVSFTSGNLNLEAEKADSLKIHSTSGNIRVDAEEAKKTEINSTSGTIDLKLNRFETLEADLTSGNVTAGLPAEPGFTASLKATSGDISFELPMQKNGSDYVCGDGSGTVKIHTTSGDITVR